MSPSDNIMSQPSSHHVYSTIHKLRSYCVHVYSYEIKSLCTGLLSSCLSPGPFLTPTPLEAWGHLDIDIFISILHFLMFFRQFQLELLRQFLPIEHLLRNSLNDVDEYKYGGVILNFPPKILNVFWLYMYSTFVIEEWCMLVHTTNDCCCQVINFNFIST